MVIETKLHVNLPVVASFPRCYSAGFSSCCTGPASWLSRPRCLLSARLPHGSFCPFAGVLWAVRSMLEFPAPAQLLREGGTPLECLRTCIPPGLCLGLRVHPEVALKLHGTLTASVPGSGPARQTHPQQSAIWMDRRFFLRARAGHPTKTCMSPVASWRVLNPSS